MLFLTANATVKSHSGWVDHIYVLYQPSFQPFPVCDRPKLSEGVYTVVIKCLHWNIKGSSSLDQDSLIERSVYTF